MNSARLLALYEAGDLKRLHALPTCRVHTMAEHVYGAQCMAFELCGANPDANLGRVLYRLLLHDAPEVWTGDVPAHMKKMHPAIGEGLEEEEQKWRADHALHYGHVTELERKVAQAADRLDLAMTCARERLYGNRHPRNEEVFNRAIAYAEEEAVGLPGLRELVQVLRGEWARG